MTNTLITGANKGLGYETSRRLIEAGHNVFMGARNEQRGARAAESLGATYVALDVTSRTSVAAAVDAVAGAVDVLDVLVVNAGVDGPHVPMSDVTAEHLESVYATNVFGAVRTINSFLPLLRKSENPRIVIVSSGVGSFTYQLQEEWDLSEVDPVYSSSKSALSMLTLHYANSLPDMRVNAANPGYTRTDLNHGNGAQSVTEGTDAIVELALLAVDGPTGTFSERDGITPW